MRVTVFHRIAAGGFAGLVLLVAGCGSSQSQPAPSATQPQTVTAPPSSAGGSSPSPSATAAQPNPSSTTAASGGQVKFTLVPDGTEANYRVREQLAGRSLPSDAVGSTQNVVGTITLDAAGHVLPATSKITVDLRTLHSDEGMRDRYIQRETLATSQFPDAVFVPKEVTGLPVPLPNSGTASFRIGGDMTVHGATRPLTWTVKAQFDGTTIDGQASAPFKITDFGMPLPHVARVLTIQDGGTLELTFKAVRS